MADVDASLSCTGRAIHYVEERDARNDSGCGSVHVVTITPLNSLLEGDAVER